jgi:hypothetical protein
MFKNILVIFVFSLGDLYARAEEKPAKAPEELVLEISKDVSLPVNLVTPSTPAACGKE